MAMTDDDRREIDALDTRTMEFIMEHFSVSDWPFLDRECGEYFLKRYEEFGGSVD